MIVYGIGYEKRSPEEFVQQLRSAGVDTVVDVRLTPWSRRPGFSKSQLTELLGGAGIEYLHSRELGNPKENREGFGHLAGIEARRSRAEYRRHLCNGSTPAVMDLLEAIPDRTIALLCYERDERYCHREVLIERLQEIEPGLAAVGL